MPVRPERVWRRLSDALRAEIVQDLAAILAEVIHEIGAHHRPPSGPVRCHTSFANPARTRCCRTRESLRLQYDLRQRALSLGWRDEDVAVIDADLGLSGAAATHREGFKDLIARVTLGQVGVVLSL